MEERESVILEERLQVNLLFKPLFARQLDPSYIIHVIITLYFRQFERYDSGAILINKKSLPFLIYYFTICSLFVLFRIVLIWKYK